MDGLMLDTKGSGVVTMKEAFGIKIPKETKTYTPVSNEELWKMLQQTAHNRGLELGTPTLGVSQKGQRLFGTVEITNQDHLDGDVRLMLGFRNSYNRSMSVGVCFGSKVFVCSNMVFTGYTSEDEDAIGQIHHRHQTNVFNRLENHLDSSLDKFPIFKRYQDGFYNRLKQIALRDSEAHDLIINSVRADAITAKDCFNVAEEWAFQGRGAHNEEEQSRWHKEFAPRNAWSLFNAFTEIHKGFQAKNPIDANFRSIKMNSFFHKTFVN